MFAPLPPTAWSRDAAAHLLNRAGFGAPPAEIEATYARGCAAAVSQLLAASDVNPPKLDWTEESNMMRPRDFIGLADDERRAKIKELQMAQRDQAKELVEWWLQRMATTAAPLREKMTLFWHGHFATSIRKVNQPLAMWKQNETLRRMAFDHFGEMLKAISRDPAMIMWLDLQQSRKVAPNENWGRELMELFTLGRGHYSEDDVRAAARAFTGYHLDPTKREYNYAQGDHDTGEKTFLGQTGQWSGDDVVRILLEQPACAQFIAGKVWAFFVQENPPAPLVAALAEHWRASSYQTGELLRTIFTSSEFYALPVRQNQVKSPIQWLIGSTRLLEMPLPDDDRTLNLLRQLGQIPFAPPNVKGWAGGKSWISTSTLMFRNQGAEFLLGSGGPALMQKIAPPDLRKDPERLVDALELRMFQAPTDARARTAFLAFARDSKKLDDHRVGELLHLMMSTPEYQLA